MKNRTFVFILEILPSTLSVEKRVSSRAIVIVLACSVLTLTDVLIDKFFGQNLFFIFIFTN